MSEFDYEIEHIKGINNCVADTLSRCVSNSDNEINCSEIFFSIPTINLETLIKETLNDRFLTELKKRVYLIEL